MASRVAPDVRDKSTGREYDRDMATPPVNEKAKDLG